MSETATRRPDAPETEYSEILLSALYENPWNPRKYFDPQKLRELADSITQQGVIEPLVVRLGKGLNYEIIAGARRFRAAKLAGLESAPVLIRELSDQEALEVTVIENSQRDDITPLEEADGFQALLDTGRYPSVADVAAKVGKSESFVYRRLKLRELRPDLRTALFNGRLAIGHAELLAGLTAAQQERALDAGKIWRDSLFDSDGEDEQRTVDDLVPLGELKAFIRNYTAFDPNARSTRMFQPDLAPVLEGYEPTDGVEQHEDSMLLSLSDDSLVRSKLGAQKGEAIPLPPSRWKAIKGAKDRCEFARAGVVTHGGPYRVLDVCTRRSCAKHWPVEKKPKVSSSAGTSTKPAAAAAPKETEWDKRDRLQREAEAAWAPMWPIVKPAIVKHLTGLKLSVALIRTVSALHGSIAAWSLDSTAKAFGVKLSDATLGQVAALTLFQQNGGRSKPEFLRRAKPFKFNFAPMEKQYKAQLAATKNPKQIKAGKPAKTTKPARTRKGRAA